MTGILCIDKPQDFTSFDVIAKLRGMTGERKIGHAGTLDPMATGVLPLLLGKATRLCDILPCERKRYTAGFSLGMTTDTQDIWGTKLSSNDAPVSKAELCEKLLTFTGEISQLPPMYSAVQVNGQRLYDIARQGREIERESRTVTVLELSLLFYDEVSRSGALDILCSKGTYIRTLIHDLGEKLSAGGVMTSLRRTESSGFSLDQCITMEEAQHLAEIRGFEEKLISPELIFRDSPEIHLSEVQTRMYLNGVRLDLKRIPHEKQDGQHRVYDAEGHFLGLGWLDFENMELRVSVFL